jgi:hypothetical protein
MIPMTVMTAKVPLSNLLAGPEAAPC